MMMMMKKKMNKKRYGMQSIATSLQLNRYRSILSRYETLSEIPLAPKSGAGYRYER